MGTMERQEGGNHTLYINLQCASIAVVFAGCNIEVEDTIKNLYYTHIYNTNIILNTLTIISSDFFRLYDGNNLVIETDDIRRLLYQLHSKVTDHILLHLAADRLLAHASYVSFADQSALVIGKSGSGKTTLQHLASEKLLSFGEEYVWLDFEGGLAFPELIPRHVKQRNAHLYVDSERVAFVPILSQGDTLSYLLPTAKRGSDGDMHSGAKVSLVLFLEYRSGASTEIRPVGRHELPSLVLESILSSGAGHVSFIRFLEFAQHVPTPLLKLTYSNVLEASEAIRQRLLE